jgi:DNA-directed RNA polymerase subunit RPC12/RpoP
MAIEVLAGVLVVLLVAATVAAFVIGLLGVGGAAPLLRCARCGHLSLAIGRSAPRDCSYCRHEHLFHPIDALRHVHTPHESIRTAMPRR